MRRINAETVALATAVLLVGAFVVSFAFGIGRPDATGTTQVQRANEDRVADPDPVQRGRIDVRNATNVSGIARDVRTRLRDAGFDVVNFGNADKVPDSSSVIDHIGDSAVARAVAAELGIERITTSIDSTLFLDATVILGVDWDAGRR